jgi:hypothetical protein
LEEEYSNEEMASDGDIYRKLRHHRRDQNIGLEMRWKSRLHDRRATNLQALIGNKDLGALTESFDALLDIPGLWDGMTLTSLSKMAAMKCDTVGKASTRVAPAGRLISGIREVPAAHP